MFRLTVRLVQRQLIRRTARCCDSPWFRLALVVILTCLSSSSGLTLRGGY